MMGFDLFEVPICMAGLVTATACGISPVRSVFSLAAETPSATALRGSRFTGELNYNTRKVPWVKEKTV